MKFKKLSAVFISIAIFATMCIPMSVSAAETDTGSDNVGGGGNINGDDAFVETDPKVYLFSMDSTVFMAGDTIPVPMTISTQDGYADDVRLKLSGGAPETVEKFSFFSSNGWLAAGDITDSLDITSYVQVHPSVADGTYPVVIDFNYTRYGKTYTNQSKMNFVVQGRSNTVPYIKSANFTQKEIGKENKSNLVVNVANPSAGVFSDVSIAFKPGEDKRFSLSDTVRSLSIKTLAPLNSSSVSFPMYIDTEVKTGNYPLTFTMSYKDSSGAVLTSNETIYVQLTRSADADGKDSTPRIIVSKYSTDVEVIQAGQAFTLDFTLKNTSSKSVISNLKVVIDSTVISGTGTGANANSGAVFFPAEGSNSFYIASIASGGEKSETIKLMAKQDVEPGVYPVLLKLDYEDEEGKALTSTEQISFSVTQEQRLDVQALTIPTESMMGSPIPINFQYINKGKATISNLSVTVEGDFSLEGGSQYIGNLTAGYNDYFDNIVTATKEGALKGEIVLKYEDSTGGEVEKRTPFEVNVSAGGMGDDIGGGMIPGMGGGIEPMPETKSSLTTILWIGIPALVVVVGVLAFIIIKKKRKAKRELVEDEED